MTRLRPEDRVLLRLPSWLGDFVMAEPVVRAIAESGMGLSLAASSQLLDLFEGRFGGARRIPLPEASDAWRGHEAALFFNGAFSSPITAWRAGIPQRIGWARGGRGLVLTESMRPALERGRVPFGLGRVGRPPRFLPRPFSDVCAELAGSAGVAVSDRRPKLVPTNAARERAAERLRAAGIEGPFLVANVGSRPESAKGYPAAAWAHALDLLDKDHGTPVLLLGGPGEEAAVQTVADSCVRAHAVPVLSPVAGLTELAALCERAQLVLCTDGGVRHVAKAVGTRTFVLFGPTDPRHTAAELTEEHTLREVVPCGPCHLERCPNTGARHHICMRRLEPEAVAREALACIG